MLARKSFHKILRLCLSLDNTYLVKFLVQSLRPWLSDKQLTILLRLVRKTTLQRLDFHHIIKLNKLSNVELLKAKIEIIQEKHHEQIIFPSVFNISNGGCLDVSCPELALYKFVDAEFNPLSDIIRTADGFFCDKLNNFQSTKLIPLDQDFIHYDIIKEIIYINKFGSKKYYNNCFSLCGVHSSQWGHFIANFFPKISALKILDSGNTHLNILVPDTIDSHIYEILSKSINLFYPDFSINKVSVRDTIVCNNLYYCNSPSYIADHGLYQHTTDVVLTNWTLSSISYIANRLKSKISQDSRKKIFLGRKGMRNISNYSIVEEFFINRGYELIYPHTLSLSEKIKLFSEASHIVGPYSSGFANIIFCNPQVKILAFYSFSRIMDTYLSTLSNHFDFELVAIAGEEISSHKYSVHASYYIPLDSVKAVSDKYNF